MAPRWVAVALVGGLMACSDSPRVTDPAAVPPADGTFPSADARLGYTLDLPAGAGTFPAFVLGHGSGRSTRNEAAALAARLVRSGFAVLRYDKRGVGASTGTYEGVGVANSERVIGLLAGDMAAGVAFLRTRPEIDPNRIGLIGASQAGWIMPLAAARSGNVRFMVLLVGPRCRSGSRSSTALSRRERR